ncbi:SRPBCC family protein [Chondromyces crocatus]|uniref:Activator of Hsp90 ATPase homologue 1/2-like C-terminal domain-containing protein n=1 Tax=Chondromyces crocatus TaxID=52 RepID=A0A0K1EHD6_CHOCO|nr:SRPBCC family protein [Chondromyces crocatus]AKT40286.1 uncharacterized protein CMC5_044390 [Chondromyces crocatus]
MPRPQDAVIADANLVARAAVLIDAPRQAVWDALMQPDSITKILPVTEVISGFRLGEPFVWVFELAGEPSRVEGLVHRVEEGRLLAYEYTDPHSRDVLQREDIHHVTIELSDEGAGTRATVIQDGNVSPAAQAHAEGGWRLSLNHLKGLIELPRATAETRAEKKTPADAGDKGRPRGRTDTASLVIAASADAIFGAFADPDSLMAWLPPEGMTGRALEYDFREGGRYRIELTYDESIPPDLGKTSARTDISTGRFLALAPGKRIVQSGEFESEESAFAGEMVMTWSFEPSAEGTLVIVTAENVPPGISQADHDAGLRASLGNLARHLG